MTQSVSRRWSRGACLYAGALAAVVAVGLLGIPVQLSDSLGNLVDVHDMSTYRAFTKELQPGPYLRPLLWGTIKVASDLAGEHRYLWFRGIHAVQVLVLLLLVVRLLRIRARADAAVVPLCLAIVVGIHTFAGTVLEAFPINTFMTILLCCAAAVNLLQARNRPVVDIAAVLLLIFAMFTVETGLLIWVIIVAGYIVGWRGVSWRGVVASTMCVVAYFAIRFVVLGGTTPALAQRSSGFGFSSGDPAELQRMFAGNPLPFYAYNVVSAVCSVLFAEPRGGVWVFTRNLLRGGLETWQVINVVTSTVTSILIAIYAIARLRRWVRLQFDEGDRLVALFLVVLPANAAFTYAYLKDVVLSPAGLLYAVAAFAVVRALLVDASPRRWMRALTTAALLVVACGWSVRLVGINYSLRQGAAAVRNEWAYYEDWENSQPSKLTGREHMAIRDALYLDAIARTPKPPAWAERWAHHTFDLTQ